VLDAATRQAIRLFQTNSGLPATGEVDSQTLDRLNSVPEARMRLVKGPDALTAP
jgi:peptidoglycan hydrolase-like protein with peptidoglycan-binding domain